MFALVQSHNNSRAPRAPDRRAICFYQWDRRGDGTTLSISTSGAFIKTDWPILEGTLLTLRLTVPDFNGKEISYTVLCKVVRTQAGGGLLPRGIGVRFLDLGEEARRAVENFVERRLQFPSAVDPSRLGS